MLQVYLKNNDFILKRVLMLRNASKFSYVFLDKKLCSSNNIEAATS
jgi:hypothetical protein